MSENSVDFVVEEEKERIDRGVGPSRMMKRLKALTCCFGRESNAKEIVGYDPDEYDYVVEKLVVKRVPLALFAIPADLTDRRRPDDDASDDVSPESSSLSAFSGNNFTANAVTRGTPLTSTRMNGTNSATNEVLRSDSTTKNHDSSLDSQTKFSIWKQRILNRFNTQHPDLKELERPSKNPPNFPRSKLSFAENISVASSTRTDISSKTSSTSSIIVQNDISSRDDRREDDFVRHKFVLENERNDNKSKKEDIWRQAQNPFIEKDRSKFVFGRNQKYVVSPFCVKRGSLDLTKPKNVVKNIGVDGKSLKYIQEPVEENSSELEKNLKDCDLRSNPAVKWRITIRRRRANADSDKPRPLERKAHR